jgi:cell division protein FtsB
MGSIRQDRSALHGRRAAGLVLGLFVAIGLIVVFGSNLSRSTDVESEAARLQAEVDLLREREAAFKAEVEFLESDAFAAQQARLEGFGDDRERRFRLAADAPSPAPIVPIGSEAVEAGGRAPFDAWMDLLFGE